MTVMCMRKAPTERDMALLKLLQENAREPVSGLARKLGVSRTAVQERINRLMRDGVIEGFTVRIGSEWGQGRVTAMVSLVVDPKHTADVIRALKKCRPSPRSGPSAAAMTWWPWRVPVPPRKLTRCWMKWDRSAA